MDFKPQLQPVNETNDPVSKEKTSINNAVLFLSLVLCFINYFIVPPVLITWSTSV